MLCYTITMRSDVILAKTSIQNLEKDFCDDLLKDTNGTLLWLDSINKKSSLQSKKEIKSLTFDFRSLYDSLKPGLIIEALNVAPRAVKLASWQFGSADLSVEPADSGRSAS